MAYPYEYFNSFDYYEKPVDNLKKEDFWKKLKSSYASLEEIESTKEKFKFNNIKKGDILKEYT